MSEELVFSSNEANRSNLLSLEQKLSLIEEARICELAEIAYDAASFTKDLLGDGELTYIDALALISEDFVNRRPVIHKEALEENKKRLSEYSASLSYLDKAALAQLYVLRLKETGITVSEADYLQDSNSKSTFVYVKNSFADEAYDVFSEEFSDPRVKYTESFKEAVNTVKDGEAAFCLLPLEERGERLPGVSELIFSEDMKIASVTPVFGFYGDADMKYALISRSFRIPPVMPDDDRYLEIRIPADGENSISELLLAAKSCGADVWRVNSKFFITDGEQKQYFSLIFKEEGREFTELLTYLTLFVPSYTAVGIYKNLEL